MCFDSIELFVRSNRTLSHTLRIIFNTEYSVFEKGDCVYGYACYSTPSTQGKVGVEYDHTRRRVFDSFTRGRIW